MARVAMQLMVMATMVLLLPLGAWGDDAGVGGAVVVGAVVGVA